MKSINILIIMFVVVALATICLPFLLVAGDKSGLFYFNIGYVLWVEAVVFAFAMSAAKQPLKGFIASAGFVLYTYIIVSLIGIVMSMFLVPIVIPFVWYVSTMVVVNVVAFVFACTIAMGANHQIQMSDKIVGKVGNLDTFKR